jgi:hypothetical protein
MTSETGTPRCLNCGAELAGAFCSQCGQEDNDVRISLKQLGRDFFSEQLGIESKVPRTVWALVSKPGFLTREYLSGRRVRWLLPLKLYLSASVVYFLLLSLPVFRGLNSNVKLTETDRAEVIAVDTVNSKDSANSDLEKYMERRARRFSEMSPAEQNNMIRGAYSKYMPNAVFLLMPVFAGLLYMLYRRTGRFYAEHLIFALHIHAFAFAALTLSLLLPEALDFIAPLWILVYLYLALLQVYGESRGRTARKYAALFFPYAAILLAATLGVLAAIFALG